MKYRTLFALVMVVVGSFFFVDFADAKKKCLAYQIKTGACTEGSDTQKTEYKGVKETKTKKKTKTHTTTNKETIASCKRQGKILLRDEDGTFTQCRPAESLKMGSKACTKEVVFWNETIDPSKSNKSASKYSITNDSTKLKCVRCNMSPADLEDTKGAMQLALSKALIKSGGSRVTKTFSGEMKCSMALFNSKTGKTITRSRPIKKRESVTYRKAKKEPFKIKDSKIDKAVDNFCSSPENDCTSKALKSPENIKSHIRKVLRGKDGEVKEKARNFVENYSEKDLKRGRVRGVVMNTKRHDNKELAQREQSRIKAGERRYTFTQKKGWNSERIFKESRQFTGGDTARQQGGATKRTAGNNTSSAAHKGNGTNTPPNPGGNVPPVAGKKSTRKTITTPTPPAGGNPPSGYGNGFSGDFSTPPPISQARSSGSGFGGLLSGIGSFLGQALKPKPKQQQRPKRKEPPKPSCRVFSASPRAIKPGESATLRYAIAYADYAEVSGVGSVDPRGGIVKVSPSKSTDYTLQAQNQYGSGSCPTVHISVLAKDNTDGDIFDSGTIVSCSPQSIEPGASAIILWQCAENATTSIGSSTEYGEFSTYGKLEGSSRVAPSETSTFVVRCRDGAGREVGRNSCKVQVGAGGGYVAPVGRGSQRGGGNQQEVVPSGRSAAQPRAQINVDKRQVPAGDTVTISWEGFNTDNCTITGPDGFTELGNKGSVTGRMLQTSTFELSCSAGGQRLPNKSAVITVI